MSCEICFVLFCFCHVVRVVGSCNCNCRCNNKSSTIPDYLFLHLIRSKRRSCFARLHIITLSRLGTSEPQVVYPVYSTLLPSPTFSFLLKKIYSVSFPFNSMPFPSQTEPQLNTIHHLRIPTHHAKPTQDMQDV